MIAAVASDSHSTSANERRSAWNWVAIVVVAGIALRLVHFILNHTIWYDESVLLFNILDKDYLGLLGPLDHEVAAPPLYLWSLRTSLLLLGDHPFLWRLPSLIIGCATLGLMAALAQRTLRPPYGVLFLGLMALSDASVLHSVTVKPYIIDAFFGTAMLTAYVFTERWSPARRMLMFALAAPAALGTSYPALFLYAGLFLAFLPQAFASRRNLLAYSLMIATTLATFACLHFGPMRAQRVPGLVAGWINKFPPTSRPLEVPGWCLGNTALVFHYCYNPVGVVCMIFAAIGAGSCIKNGRFDWVCLTWGPVLACLGAAFVQAYPYSNNRLMLYAAPGIGFVTTLGVAAVVDRFGRLRPWLLPILATLLIVPEIALCAARLHSPWAHPDAKGLTRYLNERLLPSDTIITHEGNYCYFYYGRIQFRTDLDEQLSPERPGQAIWYLLDELPDSARTKIENRFPTCLWTVDAEVPFFRATLYRIIARN